MTVHLVGLLVGLAFFIVAIVPEVWRSSKQTSSGTVLRIVCWVVGVVLIVLGSLPAFLSL